MELCENDHPTILFLMKTYMQMEKVAIVLHMIEVLPTWKVFVEFLC